MHAQFANAIAEVFKFFAEQNLGIPGSLEIEQQADPDDGRPYHRLIVSWATHCTAERLAALDLQLGQQVGQVVAGGSEALVVTLCRESQAEVLANEVRAWWQEHRYDTNGPTGEWLLYDEAPAMVHRAKAVLAPQDERLRLRMIRNRMEEDCVCLTPEPADVPDAVAIEKYRERCRCGAAVPKVTCENS